MKTLDLFVSSRWTVVVNDDDGTGTAEPWRCEDCISQSSSRNNCTRRSFIVPANICFRSNEGYRSWRFEAGNNTISDISFSDSDCTTIIMEETSKKSLVLDACGRRGFSRRRFPEFCILSTVPIDEYRHPLVFQSYYQNHDECETDDAGLTVPRWNVDDPNLCWHQLLPTGRNANGEDTWTSGSVSASCTGSTLRLDFFSDSVCESQGSFNSSNWTDNKIEPLCTELRNPVDRTFPYAKALDCGSPTVFCKDLAMTEFAVSRSTGSTLLPATSSPSPDGFPTNETENPMEVSDGCGQGPSFAFLTCVILSFLFLFRPYVR